MITQLIQHSIQDYLDNSVIARVCRAFPFYENGEICTGKCHGFQSGQHGRPLSAKNILKLSQMSEHVLNQHFDDDKLYHFQANLWHKIKDMPLSVLKNYIETQDLNQTVSLGHEIWDHMRQTEYIQQELHDGIIPGMYAIRNIHLISYYEI